MLQQDARDVGLLSDEEMDEFSLHVSSSAGFVQ
jgi:hypothetical protein